MAFHLLTLAFAASLPAISSCAVTTAVGTSMFMKSEWGVLLFNCFWASAPFILWSGLALVREGQFRELRLPVMIGLFITAGAWSYATWDAIDYRLSGLGGGANIGLGVLMLVVPFGSMLLMFISALIIRDKI